MTTKINGYARSLENVNIGYGKLDQMLTKEKMTNFTKYVWKLNWLVSNTRPDLTVYVMN